MTRRDAAYWLDRVRREYAAGNRPRCRVALLAYLMCVAAHVGQPLAPIDFSDRP
jgi:hypothetical protein